MDHDELLALMAAPIYAALLASDLAELGDQAGNGELVDYRLTTAVDQAFALWHRTIERVRERNQTGVQ